MAINVERKVDVKKSFKRRRIFVNTLGYIAGFGATFVLFALTHHNPTVTGLPYTTEVILGAVIFIAALVPSLYIWKCPACNKFLGLKLSRKKCSNCKTELVLMPPESENPEKDDPRYYLKVRKANTKKFYVYFLLIIAVNIILMVFVINSIPDKAGFLILLFTLPVPIIILNYKFLKCPKCGHHYGKYMPRKCPDCDTVLKEPGWFF